MKRIKQTPVHGCIQIAGCMSKYYQNNCYSYNIVTNAGNYSSSSRTLYTYQERILNNITYYRFRTKQAVQTKEEDIYTNQKYEEKDLPEGFVKVPGTEEVFYSYKYEVCVK